MSIDIQAIIAERVEAGEIFTAAQERLHLPAHDGNGATFAIPLEDRP